MAIKKPISSSASKTAPYTHSISGELCIGYLADNPLNPFVVISDQSGRAITRTMGLTLDQASSFADQIIAAFNRQRGFARARRLVRRAAACAIVGASVYALSVAASLFL